MNRPGGNPKKMAAAVLALALAVMMALPVLALDTIDFGRKGKISVTIRNRATDKPVGGGSLTIYKVADAVADDRGGCVFDASRTDFKSAGEDYLKEEKLDAAMAARLAGFARDHGISGKNLTVDAKGTAAAADLDLGLYLVTQKEAADGYSRIDPFIVSVPQRGPNGSYIYEVDATPKPGTKIVLSPTRKSTAAPTYPSRLPQTGQLWSPVFILALAGMACLLIGMAIRGRS